MLNRKKKRKGISLIMTVENVRSCTFNTQIIPVTKAMCKLPVTRLIMKKNKRMELNKNKLLIAFTPTTFAPINLMAPAIITGYPGGK